MILRINKASELEGGLLRQGVEEMWNGQGR